MDNHGIARQLEDLQKKLVEMLDSVEDINEKWNEITIASHNLQMENHYLRERMEDLAEQNERQAQLLKNSNKAKQADQANGTDAVGMSKARQNLMHIYDDGFHICNISYGQRRDNDEQCMFCLDILYANRTGLID